MTKQKILVVDDEPAFAWLVGEAARRIWAGESDKALAHATSGPALQQNKAQLQIESELLDAVSLPESRPGDILAVPSTGAYGHAMASNYNMSLKPAVVAVKDGRARLVRPDQLGGEGPQMHLLARGRHHIRRLRLQIPPVLEECPHGAQHQPAAAQQHRWCCSVGRSGIRRRRASGYGSSTASISPHGWRCGGFGARTGQRQCLQLALHLGVAG